MAIAGLTVVGRPFAVWPATLQVMPGGILDSGFGRFFLGAILSNGSAQNWPATEVRISPRGKQILAAGGIIVSDGFSLGDAAALGQTAAGEWVSMPALAAGASRLVFFKIDVTNGGVGSHTLELEVRDPAVPATTITGFTPIFLARSAGSGSERAFSSICDKGTLSASLSRATVDQEMFRRVLTRARALAGTPAPGIRTPAETERLRERLKAVLCGEEADVCSVLADLTSSCAIPAGLPPGPAPASGLGALSIFSTTATNLADRTKIADGSVGSNGTVTIGTDGVLNVSVTAGGDVSIGDRTRIQSDVTTAGLIHRNAGGGATIGGLAKEHASYTPLSIPTKTVTPGANDVTILNDATGAVNPGSYKIVTLRARSKVTLSAGVYHVAQLIVEPDVVLTFNQAGGSIDFRVRDNLSFGDRVTILAGATTALGALAQFYSSQTTEVRVGTDIVWFPVAMAAPAGSIHVFSRTNVVGSLQAKTVTLEPDCGVVRTPSDDWLGTGSSGLEFLGYPTGLTYSVSYRDGYFGTNGPQAFGAVPWKALLANTMLLIDLGLPGSVGAELIAIAERAVIGTVKTSVLNAPTTAPGTNPPPTQAGSVDAAVAKVTTTRPLGFPLFSFLDASSGEANASPISAFNGTFASTGGYLTNAELSTIIANLVTDPAGAKVHKSGAGTGVTHGILQAIVPVSPRDDQTGTRYFLNQLMVVADAAAPAAEGKVSALGDSGAVWIQTRSNKIVGLAHTVGNGGAIVSRIEDVISALQIQFA